MIHSLLCCLIFNLFSYNIINDSLSFGYSIINDSLSFGYIINDSLYVTALFLFRNISISCVQISDESTLTRKVRNKFSYVIFTVDCFVFSAAFVRFVFAVKSFVVQHGITILLVKVYLHHFVEGTRKQNSKLKL